MSDIHKLKTDILNYQAVLDGLKTAEFRENDRDFKVGDLVDLQEFDTVDDSYTGRWLRFEITHILTSTTNPYCTYGMPAGFAMLSIDTIGHGE